LSLFERIGFFESRNHVQSRSESCNRHRPTRNRLYGHTCLMSKTFLH